MIQYFPSGDYLKQVLLKAVEHLAPGGTVFVGDVRNLKLLECFHAAVSMRGIESGAGSAEHAAAAKRSMEMEQELLVDPDFFSALTAGVGELSSHRVMLKEQNAKNELSLPVRRRAPQGRRLGAGAARGADADLGNGRARSRGGG